MFPKWSELKSLWKNWKPTLWSTKREDKLTALSGILFVISLLFVFLCGFSWFNTIFLVLLVLTIVKLVMIAGKSEE